MSTQVLIRKGFPRPRHDQEWFEWADDLIKELEAQSGAINIGQIGEFVGKLPPGWLPADGSLIKAKNHPVLVRMLGGVVDANLPTLTPQYDPANLVGIKA
jgi:hypothetical protein